MTLPKTIFNKLKKHASKKMLALIAGATILIGSGYYYLNSKSCGDCVYNQNGITITNMEYNAALQVKQTFFAYNNQKIDDNTIKNDTLNQLKAEKKIKKYASENNITVSQSEIDKLYSERVKQNKSEEELLKKLKDMYGFTKDDYLRVLESDILREKVQAKIGEPLADWLNKQPD